MSEILLQPYPKSKKVRTSTDTTAHLVAYPPANSGSASMGRKDVYNNEKPKPSPENPSDRHVLPTYMEEGKLRTKGINPEGESGRSGIHPVHFFQVAWKNSNTVSKWLNILWPFVPAAIAAHFAIPERHGTIFSLNYIAMIPAANMLGFAGQELARKLPRVLGILLETTLGSLVEIILFMVLVVRTSSAPDAESAAEYINILKAAILGSIMTNLLLCLGFCFFVGGLANKEQEFHAVISETGSGLLLVAAFGVMIPSAFFTSLRGATTSTGGAEAGGEAATLTLTQLNYQTIGISHATSIILIVSFVVYLIYCTTQSHSVFDEILESDEMKDRDRHRDMAKMKFTLTEAVIAILISMACVALIAVFLVEQIHYIVHDRHIPDAFLGFILVPLVEKLAEHVTSIDEAYDNQINFALYHCIGPSIQTILFNGPLAVIVSWGLGTQMDLNFEIFMIVILVLSVLVVGNFLRDGSSNYLEGALLIIVYVIVAVSMWYYPNPTVASTNSVPASGGSAE